MEDRAAEALKLVTREAEALIQTIQALRLLQTSTKPHVVSLDKSPKWLETIAEVRRSLPEAKRRTFMATVAEATPFITALANGVVSTTRRDDDDEEDETDWERIPPEHIIPEKYREQILGKVSVPDEIRADADFRLIEHEGRYRVEIEDPEIRLKFWRVAKQVESWSDTPTHVELLHRSLLTMAVSAFEVFVASVYKSFLMVHYRATDDSEVKRFALSDLMEFGSIEDAITETIFQLSDSFSRQGVRAWAKWFAGRPLNLDVTGMALDWERTVEVFERRNLAVHSSSRVTRQYLSSTPSDLLDGLSEGDRLPVDDAYLSDAFERLETLGVLLAFHFRLKIFKKDDADAATNWVSTQQFQALRNGGYATVIQIGRNTQECPSLDLQSSLILKVNRWLAMKRIGDFDQCREEVESWDTSALMDTFELAKSILLEHREDALDLIQKCVSSGHLNAEGLLTWPLLDDFRVDGSLNEALVGLDVELPDAVEVEGAESEPPTLTVVTDPDSGDGQQTTSSPD